MLNFNIFSEILALSPLFITLSSSIYFYLRLNFYKVFSFKSFIDSKEHWNHNYNSNIILIYLYLLMYISLSLCSTNLSMSTSTIFFFLSLIYVLFLSKYTLNSHFSYGSYFSIIFGILLLLSTDIVNFFFLMEVNTYLFLYLSICQLYFANNMQKSIINSTLIVFIINFFSSFFFFLIIYYLCYSYGFNLLILEDSLANYFCLFLTLKFLSGPWVYFGVEVYKGYKYITLALYTTIYLVLLLPKIFLIIDSSLTSIKLYVYTPIYLYIGVILSSIKYINSLKVFLSYSTSFNLIYLFMFILLMKL